MSKKRAEPQGEFGFDVVGEDGRRVLRWQPETAARTEANRLETATGEQFKVVASSPRLLGPSGPPAEQTDE